MRRRTPNHQSSEIRGETCVPISPRRRAAQFNEKNGDDRQTKTCAKERKECLSSQRGASASDADKIFCEGHRSIIDSLPLWQSVSLPSLFSFPCEGSGRLIFPRKGNTNPSQKAHMSSGYPHQHLHTFLRLVWPVRVSSFPLSVERFKKYVRMYTASHCLHLLVIEELILYLDTCATRQKYLIAHVTPSLGDIGTRRVAMARTSCLTTSGTPSGT